MIWYLLACKDDPVKNTEACISDEQFVTDSVWPIVAGDCAGCHVRGGAASESGFRLKIKAGSPTKNNINKLWEIAERIEPNLDEPKILLKPLGFLNHGGGMRFLPNSEQHQTFLEFARRAQARSEGEQSCSDPAPSCEQAPLPPQGMRRMTRLQWEQSIQSLFPDIDSSHYQDLFPQVYLHEAESRYDSIYTVEELFEIQMATAAVLSALEELEFTCSEQCFTALVEKAWRRPVTSEESAALEESNILTQMATVLMAPQFLYLGLHQDPNYDLAERLAYALSGAPPDTELLALAANGTLKDNLEEQAERMVSRPSAALRFSKGTLEWLGAGRVYGALKDPITYPGADLELADSLVTESALFAAWVWNEHETISELLTSNTAFVNSDIGIFYDNTSSNAPDEWVEVSLPADRFSGLLSRAAFNASTSNVLDSSVPHRGHMAARRILCVPLGIAPINFEMDGIGLQTSTSETPVDQVEAHRYDPICTSCHGLMDPLGLALESYGAMGEWRDSYSDGDSVEPQGDIDLLGASFSNLVELEQEMLDDPHIYTCTTQWWAQQLLSRPLDATDLCLLDDVSSNFQEHGNLKRLMVDLALSPLFRDEP